MNQLEMLMDHSNAKLRGDIRVRYQDILALDPDASLIRLVETEQYAHKGGFSRAVFPKESMNRFLFHLEGYIVVGSDSGEILGDIEHLDDERHLAPPDI